MVDSLSVLTLIKNRADHLEQLVEGLRRSARRPDELVVVDMGSDTPVAVGDTGFPVRIVRIEGEGLPLSVARNCAGQAAVGKNLLFLDVDCIPGSGLLAAMEDVLVEQDALICAEILYLGPNDARGVWDEADLVVAGKRHPVRDFPLSGIRAEPNPGLFWSLAFGIRAKTFATLAGFDAQFTGYGAEDTDFAFRAAAAALPLLFLGGAPAFHQHHAVYDPPLQHFTDIVRNARLFHARWNRWPMEGWLEAFARAGLIDWEPASLQILRYPTADEITGARV